MNVTQSINSLKKINDLLYTMTFYGDHSDILYDVNDDVVSYFSRVSSGFKMNDYNCSLFSAFGNSESYLFGRSFDNAQDWEICLTLVGRHNPPDGYRSLALTRMRDYGFPLGTNFDELTFNRKQRLLESVYWVPDGINEHGVVAGLAQVAPLSYVPQPGKKYIYKTCLIREILDHARNVDEAIEITRQYNVFEGNLYSLANHVLIADPSGRSAILEVYDGEIRVVEKTGTFQHMTNTLVYNKTVAQLRQLCGRYRTIYDTLDRWGGSMTYDSAFNLLRDVGYENTEWSAVYDLTGKKLVLANYYDFENLYHFSFDDE